MRLWWNIQISYCRVDCSRFYICIEYFDIITNHSNKVGMLCWWELLLKFHTGPCSMQNYKTIVELRNKSWRNVIHNIWAHDDVIKWKHFPRYWTFVHRGQRRGALMFSLICAWINGWVNNHGAHYLRRHRAHYDVTVMLRWVSEGHPILQTCPACLFCVKWMLCIDICIINLRIYIKTLPS